jgi:hypothetical protein
MSFAMPFLYAENDHFTKTGSGQTQENIGKVAKKRRVFSAGPGQPCVLTFGEQNVLFELFRDEHDLFTKTGSGQT